MKVAVIGAGVVGCATAYELARRGHQVTLLDAALQAGTGTSFANGGQLSYRYVEPLAGPATFLSLPRLFLAADSPVRFRLRADPAQWAWGSRFLLACTPAQARRGTRELLALGERSRAALECWLAEEPLDFGLRRNGKLVLCPDQRTLERQARQVELQAEQSGASHARPAEQSGPWQAAWPGPPARDPAAGVQQAGQQVLDRAACLAREPRLAGYAGFVGGVWTPGECVGDPHLYCQALVQALQRRGGRCLFGAVARGFVLRDGSCRALETSLGPVEADAFVLASGLASRALARALGERLPLYPIKGYSLTLGLRPGQALPATSVTDLGRKMVLAPLGSRLRVAAMAEVVGEDLSLPPGRLQAIARSVEAVYPGMCEFESLQPWAGLRPATPDSVPIIRASRVPNVVLNVGHGALGFTLAAGSAQAAADLLAPPRQQQAGHGVGPLRRRAA